MKIEIRFNVDIKGNNSYIVEDLLGQVDDQIVGVMMEALIDNLNVEGYIFDGDTISSTVMERLT